MASYDDAMLKVTELFSKAILLPMFVYGDCMAVCFVLYRCQFGFLSDPIAEWHSNLSRLPPKLFPLLVRAAFGRRRHRLSSCHWSMFHFLFVLSVYTPGSHLIIMFQSSVDSNLHHTVPSESIQTTDFFHILLHYSLIPKWLTFLKKSSAIYTH